MKLGDVMTLSKGNLISIEDDKEYIIAGVQNYGAGILNKRKVKGFELTMKKYQLIKPNQLMWCKVDTKNGAFGITKNEHANSLASTNMALADIDTTKCHPEFIEYLFRISFFHEIITKASSGTTNRKYLTPTQLFENIEIPDFNKEEQLKWLKKVDSIINSGISTELTHQLILVKKLRQQLLQDAVQGKLVEQNKRDEPASELLKKIKAEKEKLIGEKKLKKEKELPPIKPEEIPFEIPENWVWCKIDKLVLNPQIDIRTGPFGTALNKSEHKKDGVPVWGIESISKDGKFTNRNKIFVSDEKAIELKSFGVKGGDLIISRSGTIGELCMLPYDTKYGLLSTNLMKISVNKDVILPEYFCHIIKGGDFIAKMLAEFCSGSTRLFLTQSILNKLIFPLPPLAEQNRIVQKLDELMQYCNELEASIKESESQNEKLLQQVLREALKPKN